ncbi:MAG: NIPSNAP family protein [Vicinamibacterales bacterium]|nr:NIPSNAP family protein [Vicinamibacterales bacterium]HJN46526.1 NIPSNAP family protein [Vicinamibacterales bacterium]
MSTTMREWEGTMLKWKILALVGFSFGVLGTGWGVAAQRPDSRVFELLMYKTVAGKRTELSDRFRDHTAAMFEQVGMENIGYFTSATGPDTEDTFIYILGYPSLDARNEMWRTLGQNEEFQRLIVAAENSEGRKLVDTIDARMIVPTEYSALR